MKTKPARNKRERELVKDAQQALKAVRKRAERAGRRKAWHLVWRDIN